MNKAEILAADIRDQEDMIREWTDSLLQHKREAYRFNDRTTPYKRALNLRAIKKMEDKIIAAVEYCETMRHYYD